MAFLGGPEEQVEDESNTVVFGIFMRRLLSILFGLSLLVTFNLLFSGWAYLKWSLAVTGILLVAQIIAWLFESRPDNKTDEVRNHIVYWDQECEPGLWAHNDGISSIAIFRTDSVSLCESNNTDDGWTVVSRDSKEDGLYLEDEEIKETRKNGLTFRYQLCIKDSYSWLLQYDIVRILFDKQFFDSLLAKANNGDANAQTLIGCCYGHTCKNSSCIVDPNIETALEWWHKAADQGHKYAMRELAIYHWKKDEKDKATYWWNKGKLDLFIIGRENNYQYSDVDDVKEIEKP